MPYYELRKLKRGHAPIPGRPDIRPASERDPDSGSEIFEANDDDEAHAKGESTQAQLGSEYLVAVYDNENMDRRTVYPRKRTDAQGS
jgi:hypothetical protein